MKRTSTVLVVILLVALVVPLAAAEPAGSEPEPFPFSDRYPAEVVLSSREMLAALVESGVDVGDVRPLDPLRTWPRPDEPPVPLVATVYVSPAEAEQLAVLGLDVRPIPNESLRAFREYGPGSHSPEAWPTFEQVVARMQAIAVAHPNLVRMVSIGQSVQGREIWMLKVSDNPDLEEDEPEFKYTSTMHGDEVVGVEMTVRLAELLASQYATDPRLTELVDEMEIWLCPIHNPDGYVAGSRNNANGVNLNRDYPDRITNPVDSPAGREPETQAMMNFGYGHRFVMGANYHGGALVVNVPWDSVPAVPDYAPDDAIFLEYALGYAARNPTILSGGFTDGITRGWEWYIIYGGMQDWAYHWQGEHHVTIEISSIKTPPYTLMDSYWNDNREAMLWWMERALRGVRGRVTDACTGEPLNATVDVLQIAKPVRTDPDVGDYHRLLLPGTYTVTASADGYLGQSAAVGVISGTATVQDFQLWPAGLPITPSVALSVEMTTQMGMAGDVIDYSLTLTNTSACADSFAITLHDYAWSAAVVPTQTMVLAPLEPAGLTVTVSVPAGSGGESDSVIVRATSGRDPAVFEELMLVTVRAWGVYLPLVVR